jgi:hypothetical protein
MALRDEAGATFQFTLFDQGRFKRFVSSSIKASVKAHVSDIPEEELGQERPGLHVTVASVLFVEMPEDRSRVRIQLKAARCYLLSTESFDKTALLSGMMLPLVFEPGGRSRRRPVGYARKRRPYSPTGENESTAVGRPASRC